MIGTALLIYFAIAAVVCVATWIDNSRTHYVLGEPPSGVLAGLFWPLMAVLLLGALVYRALSKDPT